MIGVLQMTDILIQAKQFCCEYETIIKIFSGILIFFVLFLIRNKLSEIILNLIGKLFFNKTSKQIALKNTLKRPLAIFIALSGMFFGIYLNYQNKVIIQGFKISIILIICWALVSYFSDNLLLKLHFDENNKSDVTALKFISNLLKAIVIALAVLMIISELGYNVNGLITGIGVGGLAISLAAQDAVSNLISGFIILFEKPFTVGEYIQTDFVAGSVEEVDMRSTKIRTLDDSLVTVPNSKLTNTAVVNISRINKRLVSIDIGLEYSTSNETIKNCQNAIKDYLTENDKVLPYPLRVNFSSFEDSALTINITCYTSITDINEYLKLLNDLNLQIKDIVTKQGASFAFPTNTIYFAENN